MSNQFFNDSFRQRIMLTDEELSQQNEKLKKEIDKLYTTLRITSDDTVRATIEAKVQKKQEARNNVSAKARKQAEAYYATGEKNSTYQLFEREFPDMPSYIQASLNNVVVNKYKRELKEVWQGKRAISSFKKGMPIPFMKSCLRFRKEENNIYLYWINDIKFFLHFGKDPSNNRAIVERVLTNQYHIGDSSIQVAEKKIFFLLVVKIPDEEKQRDASLSVGVDLGINVPAYCALSEGYGRLAIGNRDDFLRVRLAMQRRRKEVQRSLVVTAGGKGRTKKLKALERFKDQERHFVRTYNHTVARRIVDFAVRYNAGVIKLELLEGYGKDENGKLLKGNFILRNWSYFELQTLIKEKAKREGIQVVFIDPYHTSQTCAQCGHYEEGQRISQQEFVCKNPDCKNYNETVHADYNAARNIACNTKVVTKKEECEFYSHTEKQ
ncbi:MAG: transposase [Bacteroidota bacterium]